MDGLKSSGLSPDVKAEGGLRAVAGMALPELVCCGALFLLTPLLAAVGAAAGRLELRRDADPVLPPGEGRAATAIAAPARMDINEASADELLLLPGLRRRHADEIVRWRSRWGPFASPADLRAVPGLPRGAAERLAPHLRTAPAGP
jgi:competence protein ComEA